MAVTFNPFTGTFDFEGSSGGGGTIAGTIANTQVAFGTAADTIGGSNNLTWDGSTLLVTGLVNATTLQQGGKAITLSGNLTTTGAFNPTFAIPSSSTWTFPSGGGTLSTSTGTVTSVACTVPTFLSIAGSPVTTSGTLAFTLSGTALPVVNGGTAATSASIAAFNNITGYTAAGATGTTSTNLVFSTSPTLITPILGVASATSLTLGTSGILSGGTNLVEQRNGTNAQTWNLYETTDSGTANYSRLSVTATAGGPIAFASQAAGTGTARPFTFSGIHTSGVGLVKLTTATHAYLTFDSGATSESGFYFKSNGTTEWYLYNQGAGSAQTLNIDNVSGNVVLITQGASPDFTLSARLILADGKNISVGTGTGTKVFATTSQKGSFWGSTPIIQPAAAGQAAYTDSTGGVAAASLVDVTTAAIADPVKINANFATNAVLMLAVRTALVNAGLMKGAA